ncbi:hypothetical protein JMJ77_0009551 [Colletotrichum scovillei]|uniref:Uncharacterized protein n=1 Tax=Colletotrichum scovillei TaxID=1209932 RepID=A0A9P7R1H1_9PEZI|nr:hypothetical protein JMJ77_0009551 [Colletotrichum scovillei]KAG7052655.1 hypothetical protein JMJ78_0005670 [Colletotrichum scovillei]KAG7064921.1 hypothetical protein JMJ76_0012679 [Colletotrichum scovillei]
MRVFFIVTLSIAKGRIPVRDSYSFAASSYLYLLDYAASSNLQAKITKPADFPINQHFRRSTLFNAAFLTQSPVRVEVAKNSGILRDGCLPACV